MAHPTCSDNGGSRVRYKALDNEADNIHLLRIMVKPNGGNTLHQLSESDWSLIEVSLCNAPAYIALSYVWGDPNDHVWLTTTRRDYRIPHALRELLRTVADALSNGHSTIPRVEYVWADAICIDQRNEKEETKQVAKMYDIYRDAVAAIAWLGSANQGVEEVFACLRNLAGTVTTLKKQQRITTESEAIHLLDERIHEALGGFLALYHLNTALEAILHHPLWSRIWILQETVAPKDVFYMCGRNVPAMLRSDVFFDLLNTDYKPSPLDDESNRKERGLIDHWTRLRRNPRRMLQERAAARTGYIRSLATLLRKTWGLFDATDPRDLIYALISISSDRPFSPDYSNDYPDIRYRTAVYLLQYTGPFRTLQDAECSRARTLGTSLTHNVSSWAPDWRASPRSRVTNNVASMPEVNSSPLVWANMLGQVGLLGRMGKVYHGGNRVYPERAEMLLFGRQATYETDGGISDSHTYYQGDQIAAIADHSSKRGFILIRPDGNGQFWFLHALKLCSRPQELTCLVGHLCSRTFKCVHQPCPSRASLQDHWQQIRFR